MTSRDFCYWLQGIFEVANPTTLNETQVKQIKDHLNLVFYHEIDPNTYKPENQNTAQAIHDGVKLVSVPMETKPRHNHRGEVQIKC